MQFENSSSGSPFSMRGPVTYDRLILKPPEHGLGINMGAGFEKSTRPLAFASALPGRASRILASLARPGERFPPGPKW